MDRGEFLETHPPFSIALDGYVRAPPFFVNTPRGPYRNFDHHRGVDRSCTAATCEQARRAVHLGLFDLFRDGTEPRAVVWANDCDQDICLATWFLLHPEQATRPNVASLAYHEDLLDVSGGTIDLPHASELLGQMRWIFEPYASRRAEVTIMGADEMHQIITEVHQRIDRFVRGNSDTRELGGHYEILATGPGWVMARVDHQDARRKMADAGIDAAIELYAEHDDRYFYSLWRRSEYVVGFPIPEIAHALNRAEGLREGEQRGWGGSRTVAGSPRTGSELGPDQIAAIVAELTRPVEGVPFVLRETSRDQRARRGDETR